jgi:hypothetical protein
MYIYCNQPVVVTKMDDYLRLHDLLYLKLSHNIYNVYIDICTSAILEINIAVILGH